MATISILSLPTSFTATNLKSSPQQQSFIERVWQTICELAFKIFNFCFSYEDGGIFNQREIELLRDDHILFEKTTRIPSPDTLRIKNFKFIRAIEAEPKPDSLIISKINTEPAYVYFDATLESMREFLRDLSLLILEVVNHQYLEGPIKTFQQSATSLPPIIKSIGRQIVEMADKASRPLFRKFAQQKTQIVDPALKKILKAILKHDDMRERDELFEHLLGTLKGVKLPDKIEAIDYIEPILSWISDKGIDKQPIMSYFRSSDNLDKALINNLLETAQAFTSKRKSQSEDNQIFILEKKIIEELKSIPLQKNQDLTRDYSRPIINWLLKTDQTQPIASLFIPKKNFDDSVIDKVFELTIMLLLEQKIDYFDEFLQKTFKERLDEIIYRMLRINASRIVDFFSERLSQLISAINSPQTIDNLDRVLSEQINGWVAANKACDAHRSVLAKVRQAAVFPENTDAGMEIQAQAQHHLESVARHGGESAFLSDVFLEEFSSQPGCNLTIKQIVKARIAQIHQGNDPELAQKSIEKSLYNELSEIVISLMLPTKKRISPTGEIEVIDPFSMVWDRLNFPEEFSEIAKQMQEYADDFITPETVSLFGNIKKPTVDIVKNMFRTAARDMIKKSLVNIFQTTFVSLSSPSKIDQIIAESVLPAVNEFLIRTLISKEVGRNIKAFTPLFFKLVNDSEAKRQENLNKIQNQLIVLSKIKAQETKGKAFYFQDEENSSLKLSKLTDDDWQRHALSEITWIENELIKKNHDSSLMPIEQEKIEDLLNNYYFDKTEIKNNPVYGDIVMNLLYELGEFKHQSLIGYFIKDSLSLSMTKATQEIRSSYKYIITAIISSLKAPLLNKERIEKMFSLKESPAPEHISEKLVHQIDVFSRLGYDIVIGNIEDQGKLAKFAARQIIGSDSQEFKKISTKIYKKLFGNQLLNKNLITQICDEIFRSFAIAAEVVNRKEKTLEPVQNLRSDDLCAKIHYKSTKNFRHID